MLRRVEQWKITNVSKEQSFLTGNSIFSVEASILKTKTAGITETLKTACQTTRCLYQMTLDFKQEITF